MTDISTATQPAINSEAFPSDMKQYPHWLVWRKEEREGKPTKIPYDSKTGKMASTTDPTTWADFETALKEDGHYSGIGFVFCDDNPYSGIDIDHCINEAGELTPEAEAITGMLNSYTEKSQSGTGLHVIVKGKLKVQGNRKGNIEIYSAGRYFCMTGNVWPGNPPTIHDRQQELEDVQTIYILSGSETKPEVKAQQLDTDKDLIERAFNAKNGDSFRRLWNGDCSEYGDDHSRADLAFCSKLAFWTGNSYTDIDRLFRQSGLMRDKWLRADYRERTISEAITGNNTVFNKNTSINNAAVLQETVSKADKNGTTSGQLRDRNWGSLSEKFDQVMREARAPADKRDIAETLGVRVSDDSFRKLLARRKDSGQVRAYRGSPYVIEWVNRDYRVTNLSDTTGQTMLSLSLPLDAQTQIKVPQGSVSVFAGTTSGGKTSWMLELAERNCLIQSRPIYFWFNEMSEAKLRTRIEDFPALVDAQRDGRFFPVKQADFDFGDVQHPEAINIIDYIDRDDNMYLIAQDIKSVHAPLTTGVVFLAIQKKKDQETGFGGVMTMKLANLYISLDVVDQSEHGTRGRATIRKAKDWAGDYNPVGLSCAYHTGGRHGKLIKDGEWSRLER